MTLVSILITVITIPLAWWRPGIGLALATNASVILNALIPKANDAQSSSGLLNILLPLTIFLIVGFKSFWRLKYYRFHPLDGLLIILGFWLFVSTLNTPSMGQGIETTVRYFTLGISFYFCARFIPFADPKNFQENITLFIFSFWLLAIILGSAAFVSLISGQFTAGRLSVGTANPIPFSLLITLGILVNTYWLTVNKRIPSSWKVALYASVSILALVLIANNTRSMIIALAFALPVIVLQSTKKENLMSYLSRIAIAVMGLAIVIYGISYFQPELFGQWAERLSLIGAENKGISAQDRLGGYDATALLFKQHPLFGVGTGNFGTATGGILTYAHSLTLEFAAEQGIAGMVFWVAMLLLVVLLLVSANRFSRYYPTVLLFSSWTVLNLVVSQFSFTLWQHKNLFVSLGMLVAIYQHQSQKLKSRRTG